MLARFFALFSGLLMISAVATTAAAPGGEVDDGVIRVKSAYSVTETIDRLKNAQEPRILAKHCSDG